MGPVDQTFEALRVLRHVERRLVGFGARSGGFFDHRQLDQRVHKRGADLTSDIFGSPQIVISGWACQMRPDARRRRQILGFILPGDVVGSFWRPPEFSFCRVSALTRLETVSGAQLAARDASGGFLLPDVVEAARRAEEYSQHLVIDHLVRLGARDAYSGLAHLLLEVHARLSRVGLSTDGAFSLPVGQRVLAQAMGFSVAHTNQTLQRMVADGLFAVSEDRIHLLNPGRMAEVAGFADFEIAPRAISADAAVTRVSKGGHDGQSRPGCAAQDPQTFPVCMRQ